MPLLMELAVNSHVSIGIRTVLNGFCAFPVGICSPVKRAIVHVFDFQLSSSKTMASGITRGTRTRNKCWALSGEMDGSKRCAYWECRQKIGGYDKGSVSWDVVEFL